MATPTTTLSAPPCLIHERFASSRADRTEPASLPWERLSDFYKGSNRRQLVNALWMVEQIAGHTWRTGDRPPDHVSPESLRELDAVGDGETTSPDDPAEAAVKKLERLGFSEDTIYAMAQADWERWSRYLRDRGWTWGPERSTKNKRHERLVDSWDATLADPTLKGIALKSLADAQVALAKLKRLGFSEDTAYAMAKAEWRDWTGYLRRTRMDPGRQAARSEEEAREVGGRLGSNRRRSGVESRSTD